MKNIIAAKYLFDGYAVLEHKGLLVENNTVQNIIDLEDHQHDYLGDGVITPGFIDLQLNGCGGVLFNSDISEHALEIMYQTCLRFGTTSFLPTLISSDFEDVKTALHVVEDWLKKYGDSQGVFGIHLEGPFISVAKRGIHNEKFIVAPNMDHLEYITRFARKFPIKMTIDPEMFHVEQIGYLYDSGVILSIGHSNSSYTIAKSGIDMGITTATHVFNAMSGLTGRNPGVIGAVLNNDIYASVITDLIHVDVSNIELLHKVKGDKLYMVTDAVTPMGTDITQFKLADKTIFVKNGRCIDENGVIAGADITMSDSIKNCITRCGINLEDTLKMAISTPARVMDVFNRLVKVKGNSLNKLVYMDLDRFICQMLELKSN